MAYLKTYAELTAYFEALPVTVTGLKSVTVGADEDMIDAQNSRIVYPHLRVDTPEVRFVNDDENSVTQYNFRLFVLTNDPYRTNKEENARLSAMLTLCEQIHRQLWADADAGKFDLIVGDKGGDAVRRATADNLLGWWFSATIQLFNETC